MIRRTSWRFDYLMMGMMGSIHESFRRICTWRVQKDVSKHCQLRSRFTGCRRIIRCSYLSIMTAIHRHAEMLYPPPAMVLFKNRFGRSVLEVFELMYQTTANCVHDLQDDGEVCDATVCQSCTQFTNMPRCSILLSRHHCC